MPQETQIWLVRGGGHGEDEQVALSSGLAVIGFKPVPDLHNFQDLPMLQAALLARDEHSRENRAANHARQLWAFANAMQLGDVVVMPLKTAPGHLALGRVNGPYEHAMVGGELRHVRKVKWQRIDLPRSTFKQDLLYSFGAFLTVCRITRNKAEKRVLAVLDGAADPGYEQAPVKGAPAITDIGESAATIDLGQAAQDEIVAYMRDKFPAHDLARLVDAVLQAEGYVTHLSPPGPDGGADILAARGPLGLDGPTLCVQVKATTAAADVKVLRELVGTMEAFKASQGLLVSWGGFTGPLRNEARPLVFKVRLWDQSELVQAIYRTYDRLGAEIQAELPLKTAWLLVREDDEA